MVRTLRARNACKTCALGMGGQMGGMTNEAGRFPEVCKKSVQAMAADMQGRIREGFFEEFPFAKLERLSPRELETAGRLVEPLYAGPGDASYRAIGWEEAMERIGRAIKGALPDEAFFYSSGRSSNEAAFLLQIVARLWGTNHVNNCSFFCHQASGVALGSVMGSSTASITLEDLDKSDFVMLLGANPASNHPRLMRTLLDLRRRGGKVVVVNPIREVGLVNFKVPSDVRSLLLGSKIAHEYVQVHIGGDIAFLAGVAKALRDLPSGRGIDAQFIGNHTDWWEAFRESVVAMPWKEIEKSSGVERGQIQRVARMYASARAAVFCWTMGMTHHEHGVNNVRMIANLAMMRGNLGRPGAGLLPLRGHSNVQGVGSMGMTPALKDKVLKAIQERLAVTLPTIRGMDTLECVQRAGEGKIRFAWQLGGNLYGSCPDAAAAGRALRQIGMTVFLSTSLNTGHAHGRGRESIILPVRARDEEPEATTQESMFNYVRLSDGGPARHEGPRGEVEVIARVARGVLGDTAGIDFSALERHASVREMIGAVIPGYGAIAEMDRTKKEFHVGGRTFHAPEFPTATGRARFQVVPIPAPTGRAAGELCLMTIRSEGQFNTVVYEEEDVYRGQDRRDVIMLSRADIGRLGLKVNDRVTVRSQTGEMRGLLVRQIDIRPGNGAMYYPEANVLVPARVDKESRTPPFKSVAITIQKEVGLPVVA